MTDLFKQDAFEAATNWFDEHFNGMPNTETLVLGVLHAYAKALAEVQGATRYVDKDGNRWRLVPDHPDEFMQHAGLKALDQGGLGDCDCDQLDVWKAMLAASPARMEAIEQDDLLRSLQSKADEHPLFAEAAERLEHLQSRVRELETDLEISDAEGSHAYALAVDDPGKNPPVLWKEMVEALRRPETSTLGVDEKALLDKANSFYFGKNTYGYDVWVASRGNGSWAVWNGSSCFSRRGLWMYEPLPSNREDDFISDTRFTLAEAIEHAGKALIAPRPEFD